MIVKAFINGVDYSSHIVSPVNLALLREEALNEGTVVFKGMTEKDFKPLSLVSIEFYDDENDTAPFVLSFCVSSCKSTEFPAGSCRYNVTIPIIEETKRLERITCSALTFTNTKGTTYADDTFVVSG